MRTAQEVPLRMRALLAAAAVPLFLPFNTTAQQPVPVRLVASARGEAAQPALEKALFEVSNFGYARADAALAALRRDDPDAGLLRAVHASTSRNLTLAERRLELDRAVVEAATASTPELILVTALREQIAGRSAAAQTLLASAAQLLPEDPFIAWYQVQFTADPADRLARAEAAHEKFPECPSILNWLAGSQYRSGSVTEGLEHAREYVQRAPDHPNSHDTYAELLHESGDLDAAEREYRRALELDPAWFDARVGLAEVALSRGDMVAQRREIEEALRSARPPVERIWVLRYAAYAAALADDAPAMRRYFAESIAAADAAELPIARRDGYYYLSMLEAALGNEAEARQALAEAEAMTPRHPNAGAGQVVIHALLEDADGMAAGVAEMERSAAARGNAPAALVSVHFARSVQASATGDLELARRELAHVSPDPASMAVANAYLARALMRAGDEQGAAAARAVAREYLAYDANRALVELLVR